MPDSAPIQLAEPLDMYPDDVQAIVRERDLLREQLRRANDMHISARNRNNRYAQALGNETAIFQAVADPGSVLPRNPGESVSRWSSRAVIATITDLARGPKLPQTVMCECIENCEEDPPTACGLSGIPHVHPGIDCPVHPDAPGDR